MIHSKAVPWTIEIEFCVVTGLQVECKDIGDRALNRMLFRYHPINMWALLCKT